jgi:phosphate transport system substrate-binding protein
MKKILTAVVLVIVGMMAAGSIHAKELTVSGSTTVEQRIMKPTVVAIEAATSIKVTVLGTGSGAGFKDLIAGKVPASLASEPLSMLLKASGLPEDGTYQEHILTKDVVVPIVNNGNSVSKLTWEQLSDVNTGKITNWQEVGGPDQKIIVVTMPTTDGTRMFFQSTVMKKADFVKGAQEVRTQRDIIELVAKLKGGVGYSSQGIVQMSAGKVKEVKTADISRSLSIITKGKPNAEVKAIIDFLKTPAAAKLFK